MNNNNEVKSISVEEEYKKNPEMKKEDIQELLNFIKSVPHYPAAREIEVIQGYHSCYFDMEITKKTIDLYFKYSTEFTDLFEDMCFDSPEMRQTHETITLICLPDITPKGYRVIIFKWNDLDPTKFSLAASVKYYIFLLGALVLENGTCPGYICFLDLKGSKWAHAYALSLKTLSHGLKFLQDAIPVRLKSIELLNFPFTAPLPVVRPFIKPELYDMLKFRRQFEDVYENVPLEILPSDYPGGKGPSFKVLRDKWWNIIMSRSHEIIRVHNSHVMDENKYLEYKNSKKWFGVF